MLVMYFKLVFFVAIDSIHLSPPLQDEIKDGQWLGVVVRSQGRGGKVMVLLFIKIYLYYILILYG